MLCQVLVEEVNSSRPGIVGGSSIVGTFVGVIEEAVGCPFVYMKLDGLVVLCKDLL